LIYNNLKKIKNKKFMAKRDMYVDLDLNKQSLLNAKHHPLTTAQQTTLAATLLAGDAGLLSWNTTTNTLMSWNGTAFVVVVPAVAGAMTYRGSVSSLTTIPTSTNIGDTYVWSGIGGLLTWTGVIFSPSSSIEAGDMLVFRTATQVDIVQGNNIAATTTTAGNIQLATQTEVNAGSDPNKAVTSATLTSFTTTKAFAKTFFQSGVSLIANSAFTVTHNLALQNLSSFIISVKDSANSEIMIDVDSLTVNTMTITSNVALTGVNVTVIGF
jgi:hypothetical protein